MGKRSGLTAGILCVCCLGLELLPLERPGWHAFAAQPAYRSHPGPQGPRKHGTRYTRPSTAQDAHDATEARWLTEFEKAFETARKERKPVFVVFRCEH
jgi:hypothetical protein